MALVPFNPGGAVWVPPVQGGGGFVNALTNAAIDAGARAVANYAPALGKRAAEAAVDYGAQLAKRAATGAYNYASNFKVPSLINPAAQARINARAAGRSNPFSSAPAARAAASSYGAAPYYGGGARSYKKMPFAYQKRRRTFRRRPRIMPLRWTMGAPGILRSRGPELKALDVPKGLQAINTTAVITPLNLIRTGSTFCNRIGRKIEMTSIRVSGDVVQTGTNVPGIDYARIMIVYDRQTNGALPAIADILQTTDQATANTTSALSGMNLNNRDRFVMLRDTRLTLPDTTFVAGAQTFTGATDPVSKTFNIDMFVKLKDMLTQYRADSAPAVIGDIASGGLYLVTFGSQAAGAEGYSFNVETRLRYNDL